MRQKGFAEQGGKKEKGQGDALPNPWTRELLCTGFYFCAGFAAAGAADGAFREMPGFWTLVMA